MALAVPAVDIRAPLLDQDGHERDLVDAERDGRPAAVVRVVGVRALGQQHAQHGRVGAPHGDGEGRAPSAVAAVHARGVVGRQLGDGEGAGVLGRDVEGVGAVERVHAAELGADLPRPAQAPDDAHVAPRRGVAERGEALGVAGVVEQGGELRGAGAAVEEAVQRGRGAVLVEVGEQAAALVAADRHIGAGVVQEFGEDLGLFGGEVVFAADEEDGGFAVRVGEVDLDSLGGEEPVHQTDVLVLDGEGQWAVATCVADVDQRLVAREKGIGDADEATHASPGVCRSAVVQVCDARHAVFDEKLHNVQMSHARRPRHGCTQA